MYIVIPIADTSAIHPVDKAIILDEIERAVKTLRKTTGLSFGIPEISHPW